MREGRANLFLQKWLMTFSEGGWFVVINFLLPFVCGFGSLSIRAIHEIVHFFILTDATCRNGGKRRKFAVAGCHR